MITDLGTEQDVLAAMLNDENSLAEGISLFTPELFGHPAHAKLFRTMKQMFDAGQPVNIVTIADHVSRWPDLTIKEIMKPVFVGKKDLDYLAARLGDYTSGRKAKDILQEAANRIDREPTSEVLAEATEKLFALTLAGPKEETILPAKELAIRAIDHISNRRDKQYRQSRVIYTSFPKLNRMTGGFDAGQLIILSGATGSGKSAFCQNLMSSISVRQTIPCLYVNSEMSEEQMSLRWAAMLTANPSITHSALRAGEISDGQYGQVMEGIDRLYNSHFNCLTMPDLQVDKVIQILRRYAAKNQIRAAAIDYIGRMDFVSAKDEQKEWQVLLSAARRLKTLAQDLGIVVFMVAQVKKDGSLQQASYMENECDLHLRLEPMKEDEVDSRRAAMELWNYRLHIAKGRNCEKGSLLLQFVGEKLTFCGEQ